MLVSGAGVPVHRAENRNKSCNWAIKQVEKIVCLYLARGKLRRAGCADPSIELGLPVLHGQTARIHHHFRIKMTSPDSSSPACLLLPSFNLHRLPITKDRCTGSRQHWRNYTSVKLTTIGARTTYVSTQPVTDDSNISLLTARSSTDVGPSRKMVANRSTAGGRYLTTSLVLLPAHSDHRKAASKQQLQGS